MSDFIESEAEESEEELFERPGDGKKAQKHGDVDDGKGQLWTIRDCICVLIKATWQTSLQGMWI